MPASCSASRPASRARCMIGRPCSMPNGTIPMPATATPSNFSPAPHRATPTAVDRPEPVDHDLVAVRVLAQRLEVDLELHADLEVVGTAEQDRLDPRPLGEVDLPDAVPRHVGVLLPEQRHVAVRPRPQPAARRQLDVVGALVQALRAHQAAREEHLAAVGARGSRAARGGSPGRRGSRKNPSSIGTRAMRRVSSISRFRWLRSRPTQYGSRSVRL